MHDDDFEKLLNDYLNPSGDPNPDMKQVEIVWVRNNEGYGALHITHHGISEQEVEEVLFELPPFVEAKRHKEFPNRTVFWDATRLDRWLIVVCDCCMCFIK